MKKSTIFKIVVVFLLLLFFCLNYNTYGYKVKNRLLNSLKYPMMEEVKHYLHICTNNSCYILKSIEFFGPIWIEDPYIYFKDVNGIFYEINVGDNTRIIINNYEYKLENGYDLLEGKMLNEW